MGRRALLRNDSPPRPVAPVWRESGEPGHILSHLVIALPMATTGNADTRERLREILSRTDHDPRRLDGGADLHLSSSAKKMSAASGSPGIRSTSRTAPKLWCSTQPKIIEDIHRAYLEAGADIIETDTFNGTAVSLEEFGLEEHVFELNKTAAELARRVADEFTRKNPDKPRFVAGSIGPTKKQLSMGIHVDDPGRRDVTFDEMVASYLEQIRALVAGGVDILLPETSFDTLVMKACLFAIDAFFEETGTRLPVMISGTIFDNGRTLSAQPVEAFYYSVSHFDALSRRAQLRRRRRPDARLDREPVGDLPHAGQLLSQRRHARRLRRLPGRQGPHGGCPGRVRPERLAQHRRRLLRHDAGMDRGHRRGRRGRAAAADPRAAALVQLTAAWSRWSSAPRPTSS